MAFFSMWVTHIHTRHIWENQINKTLCQRKASRTHQLRRCPPVYCLPGKAGLNPWKNMPLVSCKSWEEFPTTYFPKGYAATTRPRRWDSMVIGMHISRPCGLFWGSFVVELAKNLHDSFVSSQLSTSPLSSQRCLYFFQFSTGPRHWHLLKTLGNDSFQTVVTQHQAFHILQFSLAKCWVQILLFPFAGQRTIHFKKTTE